MLLKPGRARALLLSMLLLLSAGCNIQWPWQPIPVQETREDLPAPRELVQTALSQRAALSSLQARAGMRIIDEPNDFGLSINTRILAGLNPDRLRIHATKAGLEAFQVVISNDRIAFYVKRRRTLYQGALADLDTQEEIRFRPQEVLENLLQPDLHLNTRTWQLVQRRKRFAEIGDAVVLRDSTGRWSIYLHPASYLLLAVEERNAAGEISFIKVYRRYRELLSVGDKSQKKYYPYRMKLIWPLEKRRVEIAFGSIQPDAVFPEEWDIMAIPENVRVKPIAEARIEGDKLSDPKTKKPEREHR